MGGKSVALGVVFLLIGIVTGILSGFLFELSRNLLIPAGIIGAGGILLGCGLRVEVSVSIEKLEVKG